MISTRSSRKERHHSEFRRVFLWQLRWYRVPVLFYMAGLFITTPMLWMITIASSRGDYTSQAAFAKDMASTLNTHITFFLLPIAMAFATGYVISAFRYMHGRRSVDLFHALPVRRRPLLLGTYAAGLVHLFVPLALTFGLCQAVSAFYHLGSPAGPAMIWTAFSLMVLMVTAVYTTGMFFCVASGTISDAVLSILAMNLGWPVLCACVGQILTDSLPGYSYSAPDLLTFAFSPYISGFLPFGTTMLLFDYGSADLVYAVDWPFVVWWLAMILVFLVGSILYYTHRKSECAEDHFSFPVVRGAIRFLISAGGGLGFGLVLGSLTDSNAAFFIGILTGSFIAHLVSHLVWTRTLRRFWKTLPAYLLLLACTGAFLWTVSAGGLGFVDRVPPASEVKEVTFLPTDDIGNSKESYLSRSVFLSLSTESEWIEDTVPKLTEPEDVQAICTLHDTIVEGLQGPYLPFGRNNAGQILELHYTLSNGDHLSRSYCVRVGEEGTMDIIHAEEAAVSTEGYTQYSLFPYYTPAQIDSVSINASAKDGAVYSSYIDHYSMSNEQLKTLWSTFVEEVNSPDFNLHVEYPNWAAQERIDEISTTVEDVTKLKESGSAQDSPAPTDLTLPKTVEEMTERFSADQDCFYLSLSGIPLKELPKAYQDRLEKLASTPFSSIQGALTVSGDSELIVPACCPKTRALIFAYTQENAEVYSDMDDMATADTDVEVREGEEGEAPEEDLPPEEEDAPYLPDEWETPEEVEGTEDTSE